MSIDITPAVTVGTQIVQAYGDGGFRISNAQIVGSVIIFATEILPVSADDATWFDERTLAPVIARAASLDILIVGCGETFSLPSAELRARLKPHGIVVEWMDTGAACRTFNVLMTEGRRAAAALVAVDNKLG